LALFEYWTVNISTHLFLNLCGERVPVKCHVDEQVRKSTHGWRVLSDIASRFSIRECCFTRSSDVRVSWISDLCGSGVSCACLDEWWRHHRITR
jgi:hypothetical protein